MKYMLMHKDVAVLEFSFSEQRRWARIIDVLNAAHVPINMLVQPHNRERALNEFIDHRFIPQSRSNYDVISDRIWLVFLTIIGLNLVIVR
ncbi:MAG: hypothetical protein E7I83_00010 [Veillonella sp.]|nr:hypothetical protein [Veillonella sp.]